MEFVLQIKHFRQLKTSVVTTC